MASLVNSSSFDIMSNMIIYLVFCLNIILSACSAHSESFNLQSQPQSNQIQNLEQIAFEKINQIRKKYKLKPLEEKSELSAVARAYSKLMSEKNFFSHKSPNGLTLEKRLSQTPIDYSLAGENLFMSFNIPNPSNEAAEEWMNSLTHRKNILNSKFEYGGLGIWQANDNTYYFTQIFMQIDSPQD